MTTGIASAPKTLPPETIAVVGMAGRFPGADSVSTFWDNLRRGTESIVTLSEDELIAAGVSEKSLANPAYVRRAALLRGIDEFDADFFGFTPQDARMMDPQHRLFLQCAWHALEDAGYDPAQIDDSVGVYGTSSTSGYLLHNLVSHYDPMTIIGQGATFEMVSLSLQNDKDHLATRVAHQFNLRGPALSVQTACSSSLVAVHLACQSILNGECGMALVGGASIRVPHRVGYWYQPGSMVSPTGHCRPFDVRADGTIFGSGVAVVVLKTLQDAIDDGDRIHAVIRGSAINNDGSTKISYAAPNAAGQAEAIAEAYAVADIDAASVSYVETHGTGTPLGDPIEIEGLRQAFGLSNAPRPGPCVLGSVKSNIGHLEAAAGMAGLIKAILCLKHRAIPATLNFMSPNPELRIDDGPFVVRGEYGSWEWEGVRRAGVSSFGVGGTNAHVVLEEAPAGAPAAAGDTSGPQVLLLSARTAAALAESRSALAQEMSGPDELNLSDVAFTLAGRRKANVRMAAVVHHRQHAAAVLGTSDHDNVFVGESVHIGEHSPRSEHGRVAFLFPGQGAQYLGMGRGLYESEPVFADHFDSCISAFDEELGIDLRAAVLDGAARDLERTDRAQPALFAVEYALAKFTESFGIHAAALAGHSIGEYVAATLAGVFDLPTAVKAVSMRARLMHAAPRGAMLAVSLSPDAIAEYLSPDVDLAAVNDPGGCVVAGSQDSIRKFAEILTEQQIVARRVRTAHAFHSRLMDSVIPEFQGFLGRLTLREPHTPLLSNVTGTWMTADEAIDPATWARQIRSTVKFSAELEALLADPTRVVVEVGPGGSLTGSAQRHPRWSSEHRAVRLMRHHAQNRGDRDTFLLALGQLWSAGIDVNWSLRSAGHRAKLVSLPGYPFARQRHWVDYRAPVGWSERVSATNGTASPAGAATPTHAATNGKPQIAHRLQRIWAQCLGLDAVDVTADFFELGGDSLIAISVAMTAASQGIDFTPQDLYDNPSVAALAKALVARYATGGLARQPSNDVVHPPVPPNVAHFLAHGLADAGRWRIPLILRLRADLPLDDIRSVLTAITNHHDALRVRIAYRAGTWEQNIGEPLQCVDVGTVSLPDGLPPGSCQEREAVFGILSRAQDQDLSSPPLTAVYIRGTADGPCYLALSVHGIAGDNASCDIMLTDIFTAFGQQLAGEEIVLRPVTTSWREWSQRCAGLAAHPDVVESRDLWLEIGTKATLRLAGQVAKPPGIADLARFSSTLTVSQTAEIDDARRRLRVPAETMLLAALGQAIAATVGDGTVAVDLGGPGRSVLAPDVDLHRTVGWFTTVYPIALSCLQRDDASGRQLVDDVHDTLKAVPHYGIGYGLLRYMYAPTAGRLAAMPPADIFFSYLGAVPELPAAPGQETPVQLDTDTAMPIREAVPGLGHAVELRIYRSAGVMHLDWWYDIRRLDSALAGSLAGAFSTRLMGLSRAVIAEDEMDSARNELVLVDLSSGDTGEPVGEVDASTP